MYYNLSIIGNSGSGKSTLAESLAEIANLERYIIDHYIWSKGWRQGDLKTFESLHRSWIAGQNWLIDGVGPWEQLLQRLQKSTHVIFYDLPVECCIERALSRIEAEKVKPNPYVAAGCCYSQAKDLQIEVIHNFHDSYRPKILKLLETASQKIMIRDTPANPQNELDDAICFLDFPTL